jgi:hypothetical protein
MDSNGRGEGMATNPLPPNEREAWIERNAALLREALNDAVTRRRLLALLTGKGTTMRVRRLFGILFDIALLVASIDGQEIRVLGIVVAACLGTLAVFCAVVLSIGLLDQRKPPYEM